MFYHKYCSKIKLDKLLKKSKSKGTNDQYKVRFRETSPLSFELEGRTVGNRTTIRELHFWVRSSVWVDESRDER